MKKSETFKPENSGLKLENKKYFTKAELVALSGLSYTRQGLFVDAAGVKIKNVLLDGRHRDVYTRDDIIAILTVAGYQKVDVNGKPCLLKARNVIQL